MTPEETIIELNSCKINGYMPTDWDRRCKAVETAKAALRKQIPTKVSPEREFCYGNRQCPICDVVFLDESIKYCVNCGQALDWT